MRTVHSLASSSLLLMLSLSACGVAGGPFLPDVSAGNGVPAGYTLVWSDEFAKDGLPDPTKWEYDTGANKTGWYNHEFQYYSAGRLENSSIKSGVLSLTARKEKLTEAADYGGQSYTSARLITRNKATWTYGYFDIRAKLPCGLGTWPAIWMLASDGPWPLTGEIDIMEQVGRQPNTILGTMHTQASGGVGSGGRTTLTDACTSFHDYQATWTPQGIDIAVDGKVYESYLNDGKGQNTWPFDKPQFLILNLAIGGDLGGPVDETIFPVAMQVQSVRVYQKR